MTIIVFVVTFMAKIGSEQVMRLNPNTFAVALHVAVRPYNGSVICLAHNADFMFCGFAQLFRAPITHWILYSLDFKSLLIQINTMFRSCPMFHLGHIVVKFRYIQVGCRICSGDDFARRKLNINLAKPIPFALFMPCFRRKLFRVQLYFFAYFGEQQPIAAVLFRTSFFNTPASWAIAHFALSFASSTVPKYHTASIGFPTLIAFAFSSKSQSV